MKLTSRKSLSRLVLRAMGIFGGVQSLQILCGVIRMKLVSLWIGPAGIGLFSIFNSAVDLVVSASQLNLRSSAVRDIAAAKSTPTVQATVVAIVRRWGWLLGMLGALVMLMASPVLSRVTFGDYSHSLQFVLLSVSVFLAAIISSEGAILQGLERYKPLALGSLWGVMGGLIVSIPLFYFARIDSIVPSILLYSLFTAGALLYFRVSDQKPDHPVTMRETIDTGRSFLMLGGYMTVAIFVEQLCNYVFISYLNIADSDSVVGYYQAGYTLVNKYVGLLFAALSMEYYPRMARVADSMMRSRVYVSHEISLIMIMLVPVATIFISASQLIVKILYSGVFVSILPFVVTAMVGMVFRGFSWCISFLVLARNSGKTYVTVECLSSLVGLIFNFVAFRYYGIDGMGVAFTLWYLVYCIMMLIVGRRMGLAISSRSLWLSGYALCAVTIQVVLYFLLPVWALITFASAASILSLILVLKLSGSRF
ncbi:MAG: oligosaccharide flippase family protein [Bacteroides sp.]|nr:oligosaccharide flippase family protein [Barnesiella sp.]MBD5343897.1 oligosaccharide flippase family protein [Bacteroides sp.]MBD5369363.1 oligosaccharide flippase family protein [Bacteroides sp.]